MDLFLFLLLFCLVPSGGSRSLLQAASFSVLNYGAAGDGNTDDSQAFTKAWEAVCSDEDDSPTLEISAGKTFLLNQVTFKGPCKAANVHISILGNIVMADKSAWKGGETSWLDFSDVKGLVVDGTGQVDGRGEKWWSCNKLDGCNRPTSLHFHACDGLKLSGITSINSPSNHISINQLNGATISNVNLKAPEYSKNTDGFDISESTNVQIQDSYIATGDDCVAINRGSSFINITNVACGPGHGISVGSLGVDGERSEVEEIHVSNCNFTGTTNGVRIKTWPGGSGYARKITFEQINLEGVENAIIINQNYCNKPSCSSQASNVEISDVTYRGVRGSSKTPEAIVFNCSTTVPCSNLVLNDVNIRSADPGTQTTAVCVNARGSATSTTPDVNCLGS